MVVEYCSILLSSTVCRLTIISNTFSTSYKTFVIQNEAPNTGRIIVSRFSSTHEYVIHRFSVIDSEEYGKRLLKFLFDKVLIESHQSLDDLIASPIRCDSVPESNGTDASLETSERRESFEFIQITNSKQTPVVETHLIQTIEVLQNLTLPSLQSADGGNVLIDSTSL